MLPELTNHSLWLQLPTVVNSNEEVDSLLEIPGRASIWLARLVVIFNNNIDVLFDDDIKYMFDLLALLSTWSSGWLSSPVVSNISTRKDLFLSDISKTDVTVVHSTVCLGLLPVSFLYNIVYQTVLLSPQYKWDDGQKSFFLFQDRYRGSPREFYVRDSMGVVYINRHHTHMYTFLLLLLFCLSSSSSSFLVICFRPSTGEWY